MPTIPDLRECLYIVCSTMCNLRCHFCAYRHSTLSKSQMSYEAFTTIVDKATAFGFETFNLTPLVGETLTDHGFLEKLEFLEQQPDVHDFYFCTNLTLANPRFFDAVERLTKLRCLSISIYGHDQASFTAITESTSHMYQHLLKTLKVLGTYRQLVSHTELRIRSSESFQLETCDSDICDIIRHLAQQGARVRVPKKYQNWGGLITESSTSQLASLDISVRNDDGMKSEPCVFLYFKPTIFPNGDLNACSAGDGNAILTIGNVLEQRFEDIYSRENTRYMQLLDAQQRGQFDGPCQVCTAYRSLYVDWYSYQYHKKPFITVADFYRRLELNQGSNRIDGQECAGKPFYEC